MKISHELEIQQLSDSADQEELRDQIHLKTFFDIYMTKFIHSPHLPKSLFLETDRDLQGLNIDQKGHLFVCKECFSRFFSSEVLSDFSETFTPQIEWDSLMKTLIQNGDKHITHIEPNMGDKVVMTSIDGVGCVVEKSELTGAEIMDLAGIPREVGLILVLEDGTQVQVKEDEVIELRPGRRFKKAPRFVRG